MIALYFVSGVAELLGLFLALHGLQRTWAEYVQSESLAAAFSRLTLSNVSRFGSAANRRIRRVLHLKGAPQVVGAAGIVSAEMVGTARATVEMPPLPPIETDPQGFATEVHRRLQRLHSETQKAQESIADERTERQRTLSGLEERLTGRVSAVENQTRSIAVDGVVEQIFGWIFIVVGVVLGTIGNVLQAL